MRRVAVLGTGAMGSRMARRLVQAGCEVTVWNRGAARAQAVEGVQVASTPREAAARADVVLSMLRDDAASRSVWLCPRHGALGALAPGALAVECSTLSVPGVQAMEQAFADAGREFATAPVAGSRPQADAGQLIFFVGATPTAFERVGPVLSPMASAVHHVGGPGAGAAVKLMVNALFSTQLALLGELIGFARRSGVDVNTAVEAIAATPVCSPAAKASASAMLARAWVPAFPIDLVAKDLRLLGESAQQLAAPVPLSASVGEVYERGLRQGLGEDNITGIVQLYEVSGAEKPD